MHNPEFGENQNTPQAHALEAQFLGGKIKSTEFLDKIFDLDQSTPTRDNAVADLEVLTNPKVVEALLKTLINWSIIIYCH